MGNSGLSIQDWITLLGTATAIIMAVAVSTWAIFNYLHGIVSEMKALFFKRIDELEDKILNKLEYHERHDDERFSQMDKNLWEQKLRMVALEATKGRIFDQEEERRRPTKSSPS